ncbi:MAG: hypothetical protein Q9216_006272 [Gyalolechia sp. 2 TL-2023]
MASREYPRLLKAGGLWTLLFAVPLSIGLGWTWHGWVDSGKRKEKRDRNRLRKPRPNLLPRTTRADYSWVFWDPTGDKQKKFNQQREETVIRYLPRWMRSSPFGSVTPTVNNTRDIEAARGSETVESDGTSTTGYLATLSMLGRETARTTAPVSAPTPPIHTLPVFPPQTYTHWTTPKPPFGCEDPANVNQHGKPTAKTWKERQTPNSSLRQRAPSLPVFFAATVRFPDLILPPPCLLASLSEGSWAS